MCSVKTAKQEIIPTQVLLLREAARVQIVVVLGSTVSNLDKLNTLLLGRVISNLLLSYIVTVKSKVEILQNCVAFLEYMNFNTWPWP